MLPTCVSVDVRSAWHPPLPITLRLCVIVLHFRENNLFLFRNMFYEACWAPPFTQCDYVNNAFLQRRRIIRRTQRNVVSNERRKIARADGDSGCRVCAFYIYSIIRPASIPYICFFWPKLLPFILT